MNIPYSEMMQDKINTTQDNSASYQRDLITTDEVQGFPPLLKF